MTFQGFHYSEEYRKGKLAMAGALVSICSIVRDCEKNLRRNIPRIEKLRLLFKDSEVIIFENDSKDNTLLALKEWELKSTNIHVYSENFNVSTIPDRKSTEGNPFFSKTRIEKMTLYRNKYLDYLNSSDFKRDYVIVVDLDISDFNIDGIIHSFGLSDEWDSVTANGISKGSNFRSQYHDSYALIEKGRIDSVQTEKIIKENRKHYSGLKPGSPLVPVDSAYGGMAIYKWDSIRNLKYFCPPNDDLFVQCKSEHVGLHKNMLERGFSRIFINPGMIVKYRSVTLKFLLKKIMDKLTS